MFDFQTQAQTLAAAISKIWNGEGINLDNRETARTAQIIAHALDALHRRGVINEKERATIAQIIEATLDEQRRSLNE